MKFSRLSGLAAVSCVLPIPVWGQVYLGSDLTTRSTRPAEPRDDDLISIRRAAHQFGRCAAIRTAKAAQRAVDLPVDDPRLRTALVDAAPVECLGSGGIRFPPLVLRSAIFEGLWVAKYSHGPKLDLFRAAPVDFTSIYKKPISDQALTFLTFAMMGECAVRKDPSAAMALLLSEPGTDSEKQAITELQGVLPGCLPQGLKWRVSLDMLRGGVAEGLYRLIQHAPLLVEAN